MGVLAFSEGVNEVCIDIPLINDDVSEMPEDFSVILEREEGDDEEDVALTRPMATITVNDDDEVTIGFERDLYSVREDEGRVEVCACVKEGSLERELSVAIQTNGFSAQSPGDYLEASGSLTFSESVEVQCVNITLTDDNVLEGVEEFEVVLDSGDEERINLSPETTFVLITDDDGM